MAFNGNRFFFTVRKQSEEFLILLTELKLKLREAANEREWFLIKGSTQHVKVIAMMIFSFYKTDI